MEQALWHQIELVLNQFKRVKDGIKTKKVFVDMHYAAHKYNISMGGSDRQDHNVNIDAYQKGYQGYVRTIKGYRCVPKRGVGLR